MSFRPTERPKLTEPLSSRQEGTKVVLECSWTGHTRVAWMKNDIPIFSSKDMTTSQTRSSCLLTIHRASKDNNGVYKCVASNTFGKDVTSYQLCVLPPFEGRPPKVGKLNGTAKNVDSAQSLNNVRSKINQSPASKPADTASHSTTAPSKPYLTKSVTSPGLSTPAAKPSENSELASARSNLQPAKNRLSSHSSDLRQHVSSGSAKSDLTRSASSDKPDWMVKRSSSAFRPMKMETATVTPSAVKHESEDKPSTHGFAMRTASTESSRYSPPSKQMPASGAKAAAVALLSNRLQVAQQKESAFVAEAKKELKPVVAEPRLDNSRTNLSYSSAGSTRSLSSSSSMDSTADSTKSSKLRSSTSLSASEKEALSIKPVPPRPIAGVSSIKDRLARFNSTENLSSSTPLSVKRSNGELNKQSSLKQMGDENKRASRVDQSTESLAAKSQSNTPKDNSFRSMSTIHSGLTERRNKFKENSTTSASPRSWSTSINNNSIKQSKDVDADMKWKATPYSSGLKSTPLRTTLPIFTGKLRNYYGRLGDTLKLQCCVGGEPRPIVTWLKEGKPVLENERIKTWTESSTHFLQIIDTEKEDSGRYTAKAINSKGNCQCSADVEISGRKLSSTTERKSQFQSTFRASFLSRDEDKTKAVSDLNHQVDQFHSEANGIMAQLDSFTPRSKQNGCLINSQVTPPAFTVDLKDCEVNEGGSLDLVVKMQGEEPGLEHSPPQFTKVLHDQTVKEGDSVTIQCKSSHADDHGMTARPPKFTQKLSDHEVEEGDSLTIEVHGPHGYQHGAAPRFVRQLEDETVDEGESVTIECRTPHNVSSTGAPVFVEKLHDVVADEGSYLTLKCQNVTSKTSSQSPRLSAPSFVTKLEDHEVSEGDSVTIECKGPNDHPHSHTYRTEYTSQLNQRTAKYSDAKEKASSPRFVKTLSDNQVEEGDSVTISCKSSGVPSPKAQKPEFTKSLGDHEIEEGDSLTLSCTTRNASGNLSPAQTPEFTKSLGDHEIEEGDSLTLSCTTRNASGNLSPAQKPEFTKSLGDHEIEEGDSLTLSCTTKKASIEASAPKFVKELNDGEVEEGKSLVIECSQVSPATSYTLPSTADSSITAASSEPPTIVKQLSDVRVVVGQPAELVMETSGALPMDIVWVHNEDELAADDADYVQISDGHIHRLLISAAFPDDTGTYICEAYNNFGDTDTACELTVLDTEVAPVEEPEKVPDPSPRIIEPLEESLTITDDSTLELVCRISNATADDVTWTKNERMARRGIRFTTRCDGDKFIYKVTNCMSIDKGLYTITANTPHGQVSSSCSVIYSSDNSSFRRQSTATRSPASTMSIPRFTTSLCDQTISEKESAMFECRVEASPQAAVKWLCNGTELKPSSSVDISLQGGLARLTIKDADLADQGRYVAVASNDAGSERSSCFLNVQSEILPGIHSEALSKTKPALPEAPSKPTVTEVSSQGATVSWLAPAQSDIEGYKVEMCKVSLLNISPTDYWKTLINLCKSTSYRVTQMATSNEYVFKIRAVSAAGEGAASELSDPVLPTDRRESTRSISTIGDSESFDYSEYSDYPESEYDPDLDEAFLEHDVIITTEKKLDDQYDVIEELGKGKFGLVHLVMDKVTKRQWAAKKIKCRASQKADIMNEVEVMNTLRHPKLVRLWEVFDHGREMVLIQEYVGGGELFERIVDDDFDLKESDCIRFMEQICDGICYMHTKSIVHLDLKPENVMCVSKHSNQIKLIDFGLARKFKKGGNMKVMFGTPEFVAPEVINYDPVDFTTDMWSIGVITYVLLSGLSPFMGDNDVETLSNVTGMMWDFEDEAFNDISEPAKDFISQLLVKEPGKRLPASAALKHDWLRDTTHRKEGQTLSKSKSKMKKFLARRKWQKTFKAMVAITRMKSTFKLTNNNSLTSPTSPEQPDDAKKLSAQKSEEEEKTPTHSPLVICTYDEAVDVKPTDTTSATPTPMGQFKYPNPEDTKFTDDVASPQISPSTSDDVGNVSDAVDSGYEGRKSTTEIEPTNQLPVFAEQPTDSMHVIEGDCVRLDVKVESELPVEVVWYKDSKAMATSTRVEMEEEDTKYSLIIKDVCISDDAEYECRVTNDAGTSSIFVEVDIFRNI